MNDTPAVPTEEKTVVLLVDDQPIFAALVRQLLQGTGIVLHYCKDPHQAQEQIRAVHPTVILLDLFMPELSGMDVLRQLRADEQAQRIPIIVLSSAERPQTKHDALMSGAADYLVKNPERLELLARLRTHSKNYLSKIELDAALAENQRIRQQLERAYAELEQRNRELQRLSLLDGLTGLANRRHFDEFLSAELARSMRSHYHLGLILLDVDFFKRYNDHYGHPAGDVCLRQIARVLAGEVQRVTDLPARYGGEEFAVVLPASSAEGAMAVAERIRQAILTCAMPHAHSDIAPVVTISVGVAVHAVQPGDTLQTVIEQADAALYQAKRSGRNCVVFHAAAFT